MRLIMFIRQSLAALDDFISSRPDAAACSWWTALFWLRHGRWPHTNEYKEFSLRRIDSRNDRE